MTQATGTTATNDLVGLAEDVEDIIFRLDPMDTFALSTFKKKKATAINHQWQTDALATPGANAKVEGDETAYTAATPTVMLSNYTQIAGKSVRVTGTADAVRKYGRAEEFAYQIAKKGKELKRDIEFSLLQNAASVAGNDSTPRKSAGLECMISGNTSHGSGGSTPGYSGGLFGAPVAGTGRALTETILKAALQAAWEDGGDPSVILTGPAQKAVMATFAGATKFAGVYNQAQGKSQGMVIGGIDLYISDFGEHKIRLSRYMRSSVVFALDPEYLSVAWLRRIKFEERAKTGDNTSGELLGEFCLVCDAPDSHAKVADLS
ncbi:MAG: DUF5309 domain-containing protein [Burkholderiaceae bacterium]|nr:DUF5309 domain-containing protein [Burkholderiaceae bacterium]